MKLCLPARRVLLAFRQPAVAVGPLRSYGIIVNNDTARNGSRGPTFAGINLRLAGKTHLRTNCMNLLAWKSRGVSSNTIFVRLRASRSCMSELVRPYSKVFSCPTVVSSVWSDRVTTPSRTAVTYSKRGKRKTVKAVAKRFIRTGSGKLKYWPAGKTHNMLAKRPSKRRQLRKARYANKTQLKTLNKMISGW